MNILKRIAGVLAVGFVVLAAIAVIVAIQQPTNYRVERSIEINATAERIFQQYADLRNWPNWSPWFERDPNMSVSYSDQSSGVGASSKWQSKSEGTGIQTITESIVGEKLSIELEFIEPWTGKSTADLTIYKQDSGTNKLTWGMDGKNGGLPDKFFYKIMGVQELIGKDFDTGLEKIKQLAEGG